MLISLCACGQGCCRVIVDLHELCLFLCWKFTNFVVFPSSLLFWHKKFLLCQILWLLQVDLKKAISILLHRLNCLSVYNTTCDVTCCFNTGKFSLEKISAYNCLLYLGAVKLNSDNTYAIICKCSCVHMLQAVCV